MSDLQEYSLRWRGRQSGPYPLAEINRLLDDHKIGMDHEILCEDQWMTLETFFAALEKTSASVPARTKEAIPTMPLTLAGLPAGREMPTPVRVKFSAPAPAKAGETASQSRNPQERPRSRLVFALLAVFAGFTGAHNFYARQWMTGLLQLLLSVATSLMNFGIIASWLWAIVEAVLARRDGHGNDMI